MPLQIKRIYQPAAPNDGKRILVDRLWPRGVSKDRARLDAWAKDIAPSPALRQAFGHKAEHFDSFRAAYLKELETDPAKQEAVAEVLAMAKDGMVTLLYAAKDPAINHAAVLLPYLEERAAAAH